MADPKKAGYVSIHQIEGSVGQFTVEGAKVASVKPGTEFTTDSKTAAELLELGACRPAGEAAAEEPAKGPTVSPADTTDKSGL